MPDCFISYSNKDDKLADFIYSELNRLGVTSFKASASLLPGQQWSPGILNNLKNSNWVIILASREACKSAFVNQEIGGALLASKKLVPIIWDIVPEELPGWLNSIQALDLRGSTMVDLRKHVANIAHRIKQENAKGMLIVGAVLLALFALGNNE